MISRKVSPPSTERNFATVWGELDYLCRKIQFWLYTRKRKGQAEKFVARLEGVLTRLPRNESAIVREDGLALLCELRGDLAQAIKHRRREIQLMHRLHREAALSRYDDNTRAYMLQGREDSDLEYRQAILESLESRLEMTRQVRVGNRDSVSA